MVPYVLIDDAGAQSALLITPERIITASDPTAVPAALAALDDALAHGFHAAGFFSYDLGFCLDPKLKSLLPTSRDMPLLWFALTRTPVPTDAREFLPPPAPLTGPITHDFNRPAYTTRCARVIDAIHAGEIYQANLTFKARFPCPDAAALYADLRQRQPTPYGALIQTDAFSVLSLSPELFVECDGHTIRTKPMKGTAPRALWPEADMAQKHTLAADPKSRAENLMIVDLMRNDLGRIARTGSVQVSNMFAVETHPTVHQMTTDITATLDPQASLQDILTAIFPPGSITGAPKIRALEILHSLETESRGVYCGTIGLLSPGHRMRLNVAIRTLTVRNKEAEIGIGAGIVADSKPDAEYDECLLKMRFLTHTTPDFSLIETFGYERGPALMPEHLDRLAASAAHFAIPLDMPAIEQALHRLQFDTPHMVRLLVARDGTFTVTAKPLAPTEAWRVAISPTRLDPENLFLYHKTTHRPLYNQPLPDGIDELLFLNTKGHLCEGTRSTLFLQMGDTLLTPALYCGLLPGTLRARLLAEGRAQEAILTLDDLARADAVLFGNSVRGLIPATVAPIPAQV